MAEWGRKKYSKSWPSRIKIWTLAAVPMAFIFFAAALTFQYLHGVTPAQRLYLAEYLKTGSRLQASPTATTKYKLLEGVTRGGERFVVDNEIERVVGPDGREAYRLTDEGRRDGIIRLEYVTAKYEDSRLHELLAQSVFKGQNLEDLFVRPAEWTAALFALVLFIAVRRDRARRMVWKHGRRLRGPEMVTTAEFNLKLGRPDGIAFVNEEQSLWDRLVHRNLSGWARVPRDREAMHFLIVGDSGTGKSATIRQLLSQISERGEAAIVYDPAMEYLPQFYNEQRGDVVLNPLDARCPFWTPGDEVPHEAEALTLAVSLFPDQGRENRFFVEAPRKIFAHLINQKPTPHELTHWMSNADEIDKRIEGTEMAAMIDRGAANQRSGVLGSLNMVADAFKLLPKESETKQRWNTVEWAQQRKGWIFITSKPTMRERMRPLVSLWLDLLVLRLMNDDTERRKTWFVLDELASLQHLPQLKTAVTENRKSNNPIVLGFQGKAQVEAIYGHVAEAMLSQPATKIFLKTSEPHASEWISKAIGEVEVERFRESRNKGLLPSGSDQREITREPLVMASEVSGLDPLHGYLKHGNLVLQMRFPYLELANRSEKFVERKVMSVVPAEPSTPPPVLAISGNPTNQQSLPLNFETQQEKKAPKASEQQHPYFE